MNNKISNSTRVLGFGLAALIGLASTLPATLAAPPAPTAPTQKYSARQHSNALSGADRRDLLLVMPNPNAECDDINKVLEETHSKNCGITTASRSA